MPHNGTKNNRIIQVFLEKVREEIKDLLKRTIGEIYL